MSSAEAPERVVYLSQTYFPYRVPVFQALAGLIGPGFSVVTLARNKRALARNPLGRNAEIAAESSGFVRHEVKGWSIPLSRASETGLGRPASLLLAPSLPIRLLRSRPQIVISNSFGMWTLTSILMRIPTTIFWEGTFHTERTVSWIRRSIRRWMARRAKAFVVNGELSKRYLTDGLGVPHEKIFVGGLCPSPGPINQSPIPQQIGGAVRYIFVGRLSPGKGARHLVEATEVLSRLLEDDQSIEVLIVGDGPERPLLQELTDDLGIGALVKFLGYVEPSAVGAHLQGSSVFILPTLQDNWPLVVPEAMQAGLPILLSKYAGSIPDLIVEGENGFSFDPKDHESLAHLMLKYLKEPDLIPEHGRKSLEIVSGYTPESAARAYYGAVSLALTQ